MSYSVSGIILSVLMSPSSFDVGDASTREFILDSTGNVADWGTVTSSWIGVRASFLLRLAKANVLKLLVKADNEKK